MELMSTNAEPTPANASQRQPTPANEPTPTNANQRAHVSRASASRGGTVHGVQAVLAPVHAGGERAIS